MRKMTPEDQRAWEAAEEFLSRYVSCTNLPRDEAIQMAVISDAGPDVKRGFALLGRKNME